MSCSISTAVHLNFRSLPVAVVNSIILLIEQAASAINVQLQQLTLNNALNSGGSLPLELKASIDLINGQLQKYGNGSITLPSLDDRPTIAFDSQSSMLKMMTCRAALTTSSATTSVPPHRANCMKFTFLFLFLLCFNAQLSVRCQLPSVSVLMAFQLGFTIRDPGPGLVPGLRKFWAFSGPGIGFRPGPGFRD